MDIKSGEAVAITSPDNFRGAKLGLYVEKCKYDGGYKVYLTDYDFPYREICIQEARGDTIVTISKRK